MKVEQNSYCSGYRLQFEKVCLSIAGIVCLLFPGASVQGAEFWNVNSVATNQKTNILKSPPALDPSGSIVTVWEIVADTATSPSQIMAAGSTDNGASWTSSSIRSIPAAPGVSDRAPVVASNKAGQYVCVWSSDDTLSGTIGTDYDILFARSTDAGITWSEPQLLNSTGDDDSGFDEEPWISMDEAGNCIAVWTSDNDPANSSGTTLSQTTVWMSRSSDAGASWALAEALSTEAGQSLSEPVINGIGTGAFGLVYASRIGEQTSGQILFTYTNNAGSTWTLATTVNTASSSAVPPQGKFQPTLAGDNNGKWMVGWYSAKPVNSDFDVIVNVARSSTNGSTWQSAAYPDGAFRPLFHDVGPLVDTNGKGLWFVTLSPKLAKIKVTQNFGDNWATAPAFPKTAPTYPYPIPESPETTPFIWRTSDTEWTALYGKAPVGALYGGSFQIKHATAVMPPVPPTSDEWSPATSFLGNAPVFGTQPDIAANDTNRWVSVYVVPAPQGSSDTEIGISRSADGGRTWSIPAVLNRDAAANTNTESLPTIAASEGSNWLCAWQRSDGKIWMARSLDDGETWSYPSPVSLAGGTHLNGSQPSITSLGGDEWLLAYIGDSAIRSVKSTNNGETWESPIFIQSSWQNGTCGNTTPCTNTSIYGPPRAFSAHGQPALFVGFNLHITNRPGGYSGPVESSDRTVGHLAPSGGNYYYGNNHLVAGSLRPSFIGSTEMATDGAGNWRFAEHSRFNNAPSGTITFVAVKNIDRFDSGGAEFSRYELPSVQGRTYDFGTVAMDETSHEFRIWSGVQAYELASSFQLLYISKSGDSGATWNEEQLLSTTNPWDATSIANLRVKGSATSSFVAVWESSLPSGEPVILYSVNNQHNSYTAARDWQLFN